VYRARKRNVRRSDNCFFVTSAWFSYWRTFRSGQKRATCSNETRTQKSSKAILRYRRQCSTLFHRLNRLLYSSRYTGNREKSSRTFRTFTRIRTYVSESVSLPAVIGRIIEFTSARSALLRTIPKTRKRILFARVTVRFVRTRDEPSEYPTTSRDRGRNDGSTYNVGRRYLRGCILLYDRICFFTVVSSPPGRFENSEKSYSTLTAVVVIVG